MKILKQKMQSDKAPSWFEKDVKMPVFTTLLNFDWSKESKIHSYLKGGFKNKYPDIWIRVTFNNLSKVRIDFVETLMDCNFEIILLNHIKPEKNFTQKLQKLLPNKKGLILQNEKDPYKSARYFTSEPLTIFQAEPFYESILDFLAELDEV